ncbi:hypothetical protein PVAND_017853 [Polypedilum vanderplanki]|uniref:Large ribosomal subunit protein mL52 n=1 Tax=Polypedilum vanderplanki TaxID=319348 RepID=A0A9J6B9K0_POLVA|nr:hypothetical protein PVAND_017853 [Polypedilum vanderplanki]
MLKLTQRASLLVGQNIRFFQTTQIQLLDQVWRRKNRLTLNPNTESPLTCLPDFSYLDGRPTPLGKNQKRRLEKQRGIAKHIVKGLDEVHFAEKRYERIQKEKAQEREQIINNKLKPKGYHLFNKNKE